MRHLRAEPLPERVADPAMGQPGLVVDDAELTGAWIAVDLESLPFVPLPHARLMSWTYGGSVGGGFGRMSVLQPIASAVPPEPPRDAATMSDDEALAGTIPPDRIVSLGATSGASTRQARTGEDERARKWALAVRRRQRELDAAALNQAAVQNRGEGEFMPGASPSSRR
ncbi:hypothetical protein ACFQU1_16495 [Chelatococcus sp. GCM10030263]|uniref:hypothetical protein n=1 Tax=Chelatococcus sp. GCM10030263 TaxID=3273387 RepID=UPI00360D2002